MWTPRPSPRHGERTDGFHDVRPCDQLDADDPMLPVVQVVIVAEGVLAPSAKPHRDVTGSVGQRKTERRSRRSEIVRRYQDDVSCQ
jgi:hypothetical protein